MPGDPPTATSRSRRSTPPGAICLALTGEGWLIENLSNNPIWVNGKKFKTGKRILLDTGDVVRLALETHLLFVAAGDDSEAALAQWRETNGETHTPAAQGEPPQVDKPGAPLAPGGPPQRRRQVKPARPLTSRSARLKKSLDDATPRPARRSAVLLVVSDRRMIDWSSASRCPRDEDQSKRAPRPGPGEDPSSRPHSRSARARSDATRYEQDARALFQIRHDLPGNLYECVKYFKLSLAYRNNLPPTPVVAEEFRKAKQELIERVCQKYEHGYVSLRSKNWLRAKENFEALLQLYPVKSGVEPEANNPIWESTIRYLTYIGTQMNTSSR